jgi:hypothetical protein
LLDKPLPKKRRISGIPFVLDAFGTYVPEDKEAIRRIRIRKPSDCHPRETLFWAIKDLAVAIIVAHNHPSGSLSPSAEDLVTTRSLSEASRMLKIPLLDHLIVAPTGFTSIRERFPDYFHSKGLS